MNHVHTEIIQVDGSTIIMSGVPDRCNHVFDGYGFNLGNGEFLPEVKYRCPTNEATYEYVNKIAQDKNTYISGQMGCCSKCGKEEFTMYELMTQFP